MLDKCSNLCYNDATMIVKETTIIQRVTGREAATISMGERTLTIYSKRKTDTI